jgi:CBS domain-containing protein
MKITDPVVSVLKRKPAEIWSISSDASVFEALEVMASREVGALLVFRGKEPVGIISERDYARKVILVGKSSKDTQVAEIMTDPVAVAPLETVDNCMKRMTELRVRHLTVFNGSEVVGIVSIGDLIKWIISTQDETIQQLHAYICGSYPS